MYMIYTYYSAIKKNEQAITWMNFKIITVNESQTKNNKKNKYI